MIYCGPPDLNPNKSSIFFCDISLLLVWVLHGANNFLHMKAELRPESQEDGCILKLQETWEWGC